MDSGKHLENTNVRISDEDSKGRSRWERNIDNDIIMQNIVKDFQSSKERRYNQTNSPNKPTS